MRVLIVSATNLRRGAEIQASDLARSLRAAMVEVDHVALTSPASQQATLEVEVLATKWKSIRSLWRLRQRTRRADVVIAFGSIALPACAISMVGLRTPFVFRSIGDPGPWLRGTIHRWRTSLLVHRAHRIAALWEGDARSMSELYRVAPTTVSIIPNARSADEFPQVTCTSRRQARQRWGLPVDDHLVAVVGALNDEKRVDRAISTIALDDALRLLIVGDGPLRSALENQTDRLAPGRAVYLGSDHNVQDIYAAADVVLITSETEGMPGVAIEAGLSGLPVVSTNVGGIADVVHPDLSQCVVTSGDPADLLGAIHSVLTPGGASPADIRAHCSAKFSWDVVGPQWLELIRSVVKERHRAVSVELN